MDRLEGRVPEKALLDTLSVAKLGMSEAPYSTSPIFPAPKEKGVSN